MAGLLRAVLCVAKTLESSLQGSGGISCPRVTDGKGACFCVPFTTSPVICSKVLTDCWTLSPAVTTPPSYPYLAGSEKIRHASRNNSNCGNSFSGMVPRDQIKTWHLFPQHESKNGTKFATWWYIIFLNYTFLFQSVPHAVLSVKPTYTG